MKFTSISVQLVIEVRPAVAPPPQPKQFDWWTLAPSIITLAVAAVGWAIVERFARARERRSDMRAMSDSFRSAVTEIVAGAVQFYQLEGSSAQARALAATTRAKFGALPALMDAMRNGGMLLKADDELRLFRQAVTGDTFDSLVRAPSPPDAAIYVSIAAAGELLSRAVQLSVYATYVARRRKRS